MLRYCFQVGNQLSPKTFNRLYERVSRLQQVHIPGQQRTVHVKYARSYPLENNEWGDFQVEILFYFYGAVNAQLT